MGSRFLTWFGTAEGQAFKWSLIIQGIAILTEFQGKVIMGLRAHPGKDAVNMAMLVDVFSFHWELIFLGFGTLIGSFLAVAPSRRDEKVLLGPFVGILVAVLAILFVLEIWPIRDAKYVAQWMRVALTDAVGLVIIYHCVNRAAKVRKQ